MIKQAKGLTLDRIGELYWMRRRRVKTIPLLFGWKIVKEEKDKDFRSRIEETVRSAGRKEI